MSSEPPLLLIISSPSGAGKTTLTQRLREEIDDLRFSVSHTTRKPRPGELSGREYHFVERSEFSRLQRDAHFLEWAEVHGNLYGTSVEEIRRNSEARGVIFDVDHQGARQIKSMRPFPSSEDVDEETIKIVISEKSRFLLIEYTESIFCS